MSIKQRLQAIEDALGRAQATQGEFVVRVLKQDAGGAWIVSSERRQPRTFQSEDELGQIDVYIRRTRETL